MGKDSIKTNDKVMNFDQFVNESEDRKEKKYFSVTDRTGRSAKPVKLDKDHIKQTWDLEEKDWVTDQTLGDFLEECDIGDTWSTSTEEFECTSIK